MRVLWNTIDCHGSTGGCWHCAQKRALTRIGLLGEDSSHADLAIIDLLVIIQWWPCYAVVWPCYAVMWPCYAMMWPCYAMVWPCLTLVTILRVSILTRTDIACHRGLAGKPISIYGDTLENKSAYMETQIWRTVGQRQRVFDWSRMLLSFSCTFSHLSLKWLNTPDWYLKSMSVGWWRW